MNRRDVAELAAVEHVRGEQLQGPEDRLDQAQPEQSAFHVDQMRELVLHEQVLSSRRILHVVGSVLVVTRRVLLIECFPYP